MRNIEGYMNSLRQSAFHWYCHYVNFIPIVGIEALQRIDGEGHDLQFTPESIKAVVTGNFN
jgi:hypothetical protein